MAVVLALAWMRSYVVYDEFFMQVPGGVLHYYVCSGKGRIVMESPSEVFWDDESFAWNSGLVSEVAAEYQWKRVGVPYWSLVLPLTLLSAWLILAKPRKAKAATGSTP